MHTYLITRAPKGIGTVTHFALFDVDCRLGAAGSTTRGAMSASGRFPVRALEGALFIGSQVLGRHPGQDLDKSREPSAFSLLTS